MKNKQIIEQALADDVQVVALLIDTPFTKLDEVNALLKPYKIKAFNVSSMQVIDFYEINGAVIKSFRNKTVKTISLWDLVKVIEANR